MAPSRPTAMKQQQRDENNRLDVLIIGAGLGGLGAAISILLHGHRVHILEAASAIGEVGAGIQCLPNASRVLITWGMESALSQHATRPRQCNMLGWQGEKLSHMDFYEYEKECGAPFWDFHRADLHACLLERARELGASIETDARIVDVVYESADGLPLEDGGEFAGEEETVAVAVLADGRRYRADLVVGADGINSRCREILLGKPDPPLLTGDLAYRLLLKTEDMVQDPDLRAFVEDPQVNYWIGPDAHAVTYLLHNHNRHLFNMVLLTPDDMPPTSPSTLPGNIPQMRSLFHTWDPRIRKLLALCPSVHKWRLCIRPTLHPTWSHAPSAALIILGDAAHATLPYLASGAAMSLEDAHVLGLCLGRIANNRKSKSKSKAEKLKALRVYERCRRERTERVVRRGNVQQHLYHVHDGPEREERDRLLRAFGKFNGRGRRVAREGFEAEGLEMESDPLGWRWGGVGGWLLMYECEGDVGRRWGEGEGEMGEEEGEEEEAGRGGGNGNEIGGLRAVL